MSHNNNDEDGSYKPKFNNIVSRVVDSVLDRIRYKVKEEEIEEEIEDDIQPDGLEIQDVQMFDENEADMLAVTDGASLAEKEDGEEDDEVEELGLYQCHDCSIAPFKNAISLTKHWNLIHSGRVRSPRTRNTPTRAAAKRAKYGRVRDDDEEEIIREDSGQEEAIVSGDEGDDDEYVPNNVKVKVEDIAVVGEVSQIVVKTELNDEMLKGIFSCEWCSEAYDDSVDLVYHLKGVHPEKCYNCPYCESFFTDMCAYLGHVHSEHPAEDGRVLNCEMCELKFGSTSGLTKHMRIIHKVHAKRAVKREDDSSQSQIENTVPGRYNCRYCAYSYTTISGLRSHLRKCHEEECFTCQPCGMFFRAEKTYRSHMRLEHSFVQRKTLKCMFCDHRFSSQAGRDKHLQRLHPREIKLKRKNRLLNAENTVRCKHCSMRFSSNHACRRHCQKSHPEQCFQCDECDKMFVLKETLDNHKKSHGFVPYVCNICDSSYISKDSMRVHIRNAHIGTSVKKINMASYVKEPVYEGAPIAGIFDCTLCGKRFATEEFLEQHKDRTHQIFTCEVCGIIKRRLFDYQAHLRTHTDERPFICDMCGDRFISASNLKHHQRLHDSKNDHVCHLCNKAFAMPYYLKRHLAIHKRDESNNFPFICQICGKGLKSVKGYNLHVESHDPEKYAQRPTFPCHICFKELSTKGALGLHMLCHVKTKAHHCDECDAKFARKCELKRHKESHPDGNIYECSLCGKQYPVMSKLRSHMYAHSKSHN